MDITFGSVASGIEAASVAWHPLGWRAAWLGEIEPFPSKVLHHHYRCGRPHFMLSPDEDGISDDDRKDRRAAMRAVSDLPLVPLDGKIAPNLGDLTRIAALVRAGLVPAPDVLVGGTPCQAFSIAGLRKSLDDARGQLTLSFVDLANAIDSVRLIRGEPAATILWENVPGVLNTADNAFGCFLAALAGEDEPLQPSGGKWTNAGCVFGPVRAVAWRVMDAQYFGVAQRRRRVFVVASARAGFNPTEVLFEFDGVRRDIAPSREAREDVAASAASSTSSRGGQPAGDDLFGGFGDAGGNGLDGVAATLTSAMGKRNGMPDCGSSPGLLQPVTCMAHGQGGAEIADDRSPTLTCNHEAPIAVYNLTFCDANGRRADRRDGGLYITENPDTAPTLTQADSSIRIVQPAVYAFQPRIGRNGRGDMGDVVNALTAEAGETGKGDSAPCVAIAFDSRQECISSTEVFGALGSSSPQAQAICLIQFGNEVAGTLTARHDSSPCADRGQNVVAFAENSRGEIRLEGGDGTRTGALSTGGGKPGQGVPTIAMRESGLGYWVEDTVAGTLDANMGLSGHASRPAVFKQPSMAVRRLTPRECERLQAFPDDWTLIPYPLKHVNPDKLDRDYIKYLARGGVLTFEQCCNAAADGPRYKALGNSMCVYNMAWLGRRIDAAIRLQVT